MVISSSEGFTQLCAGGLAAGYLCSPTDQAAPRCSWPSWGQLEVAGLVLGVTPIQHTGMLRGILQALTGADPLQCRSQSWELALTLRADLNQCSRVQHVAFSLGAQAERDMRCGL